MTIKYMHGDEQQAWVGAMEDEMVSDPEKSIDVLEGRRGGWCTECGGKAWRVKAWSRANLERHGFRPAALRRGGIVTSTGPRRVWGDERRKR